MFIILLKFSKNREQAASLMAGHSEWIQRGFEEGVFLLVGRIEPQSGGSIIADKTTREALEIRVQADPFVAQDVVHAEILEITPSQADPRLAFLLS